MDILDASKIIALAGTGGVLFWFIILSLTYDIGEDPFFAESNLDISRIRANVAGTATSLAGALFFFMSNAAFFGLIILLVPIFNALGIMLFTKLTDNREPDPETNGSIYRFIQTSYEDKLLSRIANIFVVVNFVAIFVIEIAIGSTIFGYIIGGSPFYVPIIACILAIVAFIYVMKGGFSAVTHTDNWQVVLLFVGLIVTFISFSFVVAADINIAANAISTIWPPFATPFEVSDWIKVTFLVNMIVINLTLPTSQVSTWERYAASGSREIAVKGFWQGVIIGLLPLWSLAILLAFILIGVDSTQIGFIGLFNIIFSKLGFLALFVFPILFVGLVAALLSTADSVMIATMLAVNDFKGKTSLVFTKKVMVFVGTLLIVISTIVSYLFSLSGELEVVITKALFAAYGVPCLLFPIIYYACKDQSSNYGTKSISIALLIGFLVLIGFATHGFLSGDFRSNILGPVIAIFVVWTIMKMAKRLGWK